jgi:hypothetical protein
MSKLCIGLFGTCGVSRWRDKFIEQYDFMSCDFFNPQKDDWKPEDAEIEAEHLAEDQVILLPVLSETYGLGSLAEIGFSIAQAMKSDDRRDFVILVDQKPDDALQSELALYRESYQNRALVKAHLKKLRLPNVFVVDTLDEMLELSLDLYRNAERIKLFCEKYNPHNRK